MRSITGGILVLELLAACSSALIGQISDRSIDALPDIPGLPDPFVFFDGSPVRPASDCGRSMPAVCW